MATHNVVALFNKQITQNALGLILSLN